MKKTNFIDNNTETINDQKSNLLNSFESNFESLFFYTNDKFINQMDYIDVFQSIQLKYPKFNIKETDIIIKKQFINILNDNSFVNNILEHFSLTLFDFFTIIYKQFSFIFKGQFIKKVKNVLIQKNYELCSKSNNR